MDVNRTNNRTSSDEMDEDTLLLINLYRFLIPLMCVFCMISICVNIRVLLSAHWIRRPLSPTLHISLSLAAADACSSLLLGTGLIINSYLPIVHNMKILPTISFIQIEMFRLSGILITVAHLLALSVNHWLGILKPLHYTTMMTTRKVTIVIVMLWMVPTGLFVVYFQSKVNSDGLESLNMLTFRLVFSSLLFVPLILMVLFYTHILFMVRKQQKLWAQLSRSGSKKSKGTCKSQQQRRTMEGNVKAICTTLLILGSCLVGWMPATLTFLLICDEGCVYLRDDISISPTFQFMIPWMCNTLLILKTLANPIIYSSRMIEIKEGIRKMHHAANRAFCKTTTRTNMNRPIIYSQSNNAGGTALYKFNGSLGTTRKSVRCQYPNTPV
ncbi:PREDICTED: trace amine-associated receptor 2-like [Nicrophorus vespilloides]|uniref:Trace amine-associated receptor 2-like n=1 Tax=Nicrophorus vespilloides TaxID=110193 RepID=A0ABM1MNQ5_NICVS|nr:PREDICTED: trace amine-associated receptor 2-like [Nicrophorus vespilloides]